MKYIILTISMFALAGFSCAAFETWTSKDGRDATMNLIEVQEVDDSKVGVFLLRSGQRAEIEASDLAEESAERLKNWKGNVTGKESVFDDYIDGNLKKLDDSRLKRLSDFQRPDKYYVFYYTASWCGPCQKFTPSLVKFYNEHKNDNFEIVLITSDRNRKSMENYAKNKKMPWPHLDYSDARKFKRNFEHGVSGIPSLVVCDLEGKVLGEFSWNLAALTKLIK